MKRFIIILASVLMLASSAFGATAGNVDGIGDIDLKDVILSIQVSAGITPKSYVYKKYDINGDGKIGLEEAVYDLQVVAAIREKAAIWYKDADGDKYSDGTAQISVTRPSAIYFEETELTAISGDADDNNPNIHPDSTPQWTAFNAADPAAPTDTVGVSVPTDTSQEVVIEYGIPGMNTSETPEEGQIYDILNIAGCGYTNEIGKPQLPVISRYVAVPSGATVSAQVIDSAFRDISGYKVYPVQHPLADTDDAPVPPFEIDSAFYQTDSFYPSEIVGIEGPFIIRGVSTVIVQIYPVRYNPAQKTLRAYSKIKIRLTFSGGTRAVRDQRLRSPSFDQMLERLVLNNNLLSSGKDTRAAYDNGNSLLIITHPNFTDAANTLKNWKIRKGIYTEVRTTTQTGSTASAIQSYIRTAYNTWTVPPTYVLLIGDAEFIPTHYSTVHPYHGTRTGTDLYYSTVDGSDYFPDINLGRLSVDTLAQANKRVNDIISYEKAVVTDSNFYKKAALAAYFQHYGSGYDSRRFAQTAEDVAIFLSDSRYLGQYSVDRIYYVESDVNPKNWATVSWNFGGGPAGNPGAALPSYLLKPAFAWNGDSSNISSAINSGRFLLIHRDHGAEWGWGDPYYHSSHVQALTNSNRLPVVWSINCQTGWFDNETDEAGDNTSSDAVHFSEAWERNPNGGAVGVIGATRVSYSGHNDRLVWGWTDAVWPGFESYTPSNTPFNNPVWEMGPVLNYGKYYYATKYGEDTYRKTEFELFHWFGDPTMQIWTDVPQTLTVSHLSALSSGATSVDVTVSQADAVICVSRNGAILSRKLSAGGITTLSWSAPLVLGDVIYITVTKHNFRPYEGSASCSSSCSYSINPTSNSFSASGGTGSISVTAASGCAWTAANSDPSWITITSGPSGNGNGTVGYSVSAYTGTGSRTGTITIGGKVFTITQTAPQIIQFSSSAYNVGEADGSALITVTRTGGTSGTASVNYATNNGTAVSGSDYVSTLGTMTFGIGETAKTFPVGIINDTAIEGNETVNLTLSNPTGATLGSPSSAVLTITDDDVAQKGQIQFGSATYSVNESGGSVTITVTRTGGSSGAVGVSYSVGGGTAAVGQDYSATSGTITFADGDTADKTFSISILNDSVVEGNETANLALSNPTGGAVLGSTSSAVLTIADDDSPPTVDLFLQNETVATLLNYTTSNSIWAGYDITTQKPYGDYVIQSGGNVTLNSKTIYLKPGFKASSGSTFKATAQ